MCVTLKEELNLARLTVMEKASALFDKLDTDKVSMKGLAIVLVGIASSCCFLSLFQNGLIDALEMICSLAALSGMKLAEIMECK
jgi:hypothetical protein